MIRRRRTLVCRRKTEKFGSDLPWLPTLQLLTLYVILFVLQRDIVYEDHIYAYVAVNMVNNVMFNLLQLKVLAEDGGSPPRSATATVSITVERNLAAPEFTPQRYETEILEV